MKFSPLLLLVACRAPDSIGVNYGHGVAEGNGNNAARETSMTTDADYGGVFASWDFGNRLTMLKAQEAARAAEASWRAEELAYLKAIAQRPEPVLDRKPIPAEAKTPEPAKVPASQDAATLVPKETTKEPFPWTLVITSATTIILGIIGIWQREKIRGWLGPKPEEPAA